MPMSSNKFGINGRPSMLCNTPSAAIKPTRPKTPNATAAGFSSVSSHFSLNVPVSSFNLSWTSSLLVVAFTLAFDFWTDTVDVLNCFPTKVVLLKEFEDRLTLIERVAKTLLEAMIDCILRIFVCVCVCVFSLWRVSKRYRAGGSLRSFQRLMCEIISQNNHDFDWLSEAQKLHPQNNFWKSLQEGGGLAYNSWIWAFGHKFLHFTISGWMRLRKRKKCA